MGMNGVNPAEKSFLIQQYEKLSETADDGSFKKTLNNLMDQFGDIQETAARRANDVVSGNPVDSHDVMIAVQEAGLAFELMLEVRNKLVDAYHELMRMQI